MCDWSCTFPILSDDQLYSLLLHLMELKQVSNIHLLHNLER